MPNIFGNIYPIMSFLWAENNALYHCTIIIVGIHSNSTTKQHKRLVFRRMPMYLNLRSWLHGIQKSMTLILKALLTLELCSLIPKVLRSCSSLQAKR